MYIYKELTVIQQQHKLPWVFTTKLEIILFLKGKEIIFIGDTGPQKIFNKGQGIRGPFPKETDTNCT